MTKPDFTKRSSEEAESQREAFPHSGALHKWMMTACVVLMGGAVLFFMWRGQSLGSGAWLVLPLALCLGMHLLMYRHGQHHDE